MMASHLQVFINRDDLDFSTAGELPAVQEWDLLENLNGQIEYPTRLVQDERRRRAQPAAA